MGCLVVLILAAFVLIGRCFIEPRLDLPTWEGTYESVAHLFVGGLFGAWWIRRGTGAERIDGCGYQCMALAVVLSLYELVFFLCQKFGG